MSTMSYEVVEAVRRYNDQMREYERTNTPEHGSPVVRRCLLGPVEGGTFGPMQMVIKAEIRGPGMFRSSAEVGWWRPDPLNEKGASLVWYASTRVVQGTGDPYVDGSAGATAEPERGYRMAMMFAYAQTLIDLGLIELTPTDALLDEKLEVMEREAYARAAMVRDVINTGNREGASA